MIPARVDTELWLRRFHAARPGAPCLVCFSHAGGSASWFHPMSAALSPQLDVVAVQYPGRQDRRKEPTDYGIADLAAAIAAAFAEDVRGRGPSRLLFFGHSMGAAVAYETALALTAAGVDGPDHVVVSGRRSPTRPANEQVHLLDDAGVLRELRSLNGTDSRLLDDEEIVRMTMPAIRADYRAIETYLPADPTPLACPVTALTGDNDPKTTVDDVRAWQELTTAAFESLVLPGGHFFLVHHQQTIFQLIRSLAAKAR
jgi:surfactin synthase thioesterase subunit